MVTTLNTATIIKEAKKVLDDVRGKIHHIDAAAFEACIYRLAELNNDLRTPRRVQLSRRRGWRKPQNTISVARPGPWGNPFKVGQLGIDSLEVAVTRYRQEWVMGTFKNLGLDIEELRGKNLACWCRLDEPWCHAEVLLELANKPEGGQ